LLLFAAAGAAIFAMSTSLSGLWIGRALIGVGVSSCLMAPFKAYRQWYAPERLSQLTSWMLVAGISGALAATIPVTTAMLLVGWRGVFWIMAGLILPAAAAIFFLLRKVEREAAGWLWPYLRLSLFPPPRAAGYDQPWHIYRIANPVGRSMDDYRSGHEQGTDCANSVHIQFLPDAGISRLVLMGAASRIIRR
jgi:MFS family permease